jgi:hypothetical protein
MRECDSCRTLTFPVIAPNNEVRQYIIEFTITDVKEGKREVSVITLNLCRKHKEEISLGIRKVFDDVEKLVRI